MKKSVVATALASALVGGLLAQATPAHAWWSRQFVGEFGPFRSGERVYGQVENVPVNDSSAQPRTSAATINVEAYNYRNDSDTRITLCAAHWAGNGTTCSAEVRATGSGHKKFSMASHKAAWANAGDFAYVRVTALTTTNTAATSVRINGIYLSN